MDISKIKELEAALCNHELGSLDPKGSPAYLEGRHIYSVTVEADYDGKTRATVHTQAKYVEELLRDNPGAVTWKSKWVSGERFLYVKVNGITYMCIRDADQN